MKTFIISEEEKKRILNLHETMTKNHYLMEQEESQVVTCLKNDGFQIPSNKNAKYKTQMIKQMDNGKFYVSSVDDITFTFTFIATSGTQQNKDVKLKNFDCNVLKSEIQKMFMK